METDAAEKEGPEERTEAGWQLHWQAELEQAAKRLREFSKQGNTVVKRFLDERKGSEGKGPTTSLNLFHTNISTMQSMLYGNTPRIDVSREHHDPDDDIARVAAVLYQRILEADVEPSGEDLSTTLKAALQDRLLPGMGAARVRYNIETSTTEVPDGNGEMIEQKILVSEEAPIDYVHWQDVLWGWGRTWSEIPWWGFRSWMTKEEAGKRFGKDKVETLDYKAQIPEGHENQEQTSGPDQKSRAAKAEIWEIWCKTEKDVFWHAPGTDKILDQKEDPLKLNGFFPMPRPMTANTTTTLFTPKADYVINQDIYNEIDILQSRITIITRAIKVVGVYDKSAEGVRRMLQEGFENDLIAVDNWAMFAEKGGLAGTVDWFPVQEVVTTLQTLIEIQENKIAQLNELTGMSEIMRGGAGGQYTAAASNQVAAKMGSIRVQALQDEFARFASDLEALKAEVIGKHFSPSTIYKQSNAQFMPEADRHLVQPAIQLMQAEEVSWRIDIKPESIAMIDYAQLKSERTEFLTAMATYLQSAQAVVQAVPGSLPILLEMLKWGMAGFKGSNYLEGTMDRAIDMAKKAPQGGQDDGKAQEGQIKLQIEQIKQQGQQQKQQGELQKIQMKAQADMQAQQQKLHGEIQKIQMDLQADMTLEERQAKNRQVEIMMETQQNLRESQESLKADLTVERAQAAYDIQGQQVEHRNNITEIHANGQMAARQQNAQTDTD